MPRPPALGIHRAATQSLYSSPRCEPALPTVSAVPDRSRAHLLAYAVAGILILVAGFRFLDDGGDGRAPESPRIALDGEGGAAPGKPGEEHYVHIAGAVREEGLYRVPAGSRVGAAVERAGGVVHGADLRGVNLAAQVQDGQQIVVPKRGAVAPGGAASSGSGTAAAGAAAAGGAPAGPISLASATVEQLDAGVEGIGPTLAARIIEYRDQNGGFESLEELRQVEGIGEARFTALSEAVGP